MDWYDTYQAVYCQRGSVLAMLLLPCDRLARTQRGGTIRQAAAGLQRKPRAFFVSLLNSDCCPLGTNAVGRPDLS